MSKFNFKNWTIPSQHPLRIAVDILVILAVFGSLIESPYRYVFHIPLKGFWIQHQVFFILCFAAHFFLSLRTTYWWRGEEVRDIERIKKRNLHWGTIFDVLPMIPLEILFPNASTPVLWCFFIIRISKMMHFWQFNQIIKNLENAIMLHPSIIRSAISIVAIAGISHWVALGWLSVSHTPLVDNWDTYIDALYWAVTTLTTVGYGDITPVTSIQKIYTMIVMFTGVAMYGYIIGNIASLLGSFDAAKKDHLEKLERILSFMKYKKIPAITQKRVRHYFFYLWETKQSLDYHSILHELPPSIYIELSAHLNQDLLQKVPLFQEASPNLLSHLARKMRPVVFHAGETIFKKGQPGDAMYFILRGRIMILNDEHGEVLAELSEGHFFGEMSLIQNTPRTRTVQSIDFCELYALERHDFEEAITKFPELELKIRETIEVRQAPTAAEV